MFDLGGLNNNTTNLILHPLLYSNRKTIFGLTKTDHRIVVVVTLVNLINSHYQYDIGLANLKPTAPSILPLDLELPQPNICSSNLTTTAWIVNATRQTRFSSLLTSMRRGPRGLAPYFEIYALTTPDTHGTTTGARECASR